MADRRTRLVRVAFVVLLVVSCAQVVWWIIDQRRLSVTIERARIESYELDREAAGRLLKRGEPIAELAVMFPHLSFTEATEGPVVGISAAARAGLEGERLRHARQYGWESAFFLIVLLSCIGVVWRGLREEARLRQRHENFLASVSHELRSPLSSLRLQTETLLRRRLSEERRAELLDRSLEDLTRLDGLVENVLEAARIDDQQGRALLRWEAEPVDVEAAVAKQLEELAAQPEGGVVNEVRPGTDAYIDPGALDTILRNLLANAARATQDGGSVVVRGERRDGQVVVEVVDSGVGFEHDEASHLFEKFYRPGSALRGRAGGTGLGLYIVRHLTRLGGGTVSAHSDGPGRGATFELLLPAAGESVSLSQDNETLARVLLVEDEPHLALGLVENLEVEGYEVVHMGDGESGLAEMTRGRFDLAILDVMLPKLDGFSLCEAARLDGVTTPVLFLTAKGGVDDRIRGLRAGGDDYLPKPFHLDELLLRVAAVIRRGRSDAGETTRVEFGGNVVDLQAYRATSWSGESHDLTHKEAMILKALAARPGEVVSRDEILDRVWGRDVYPSSRTIDNFILKLRRRFEREPDEPLHFHSVRGVGYRFTIEPE